MDTGDVAEIRRVTGLQWSHDLSAMDTFLLLQWSHDLSAMDTAEIQDLPPK